MPRSVLESSEEKIYGFKLIRLIVDGGTEALRNIFLNIHPGNLQSILSIHHPTLQRLFKIKKKIITQPQWDKLYPHTPKIPNIKEFDITLLVILLRNICGISPPSTGWNVMPHPADNSREADIFRIKLFRNNCFGHVHRTAVSKSDFEADWAELSSALRRLGFGQAEIDRLKTEECGEEEVDRVRKEWSEIGREIVTKLNELEKNLKQGKFYTDDIISECLHWCEFKKEIQLLHEKYTVGTREWVFQQVSTWLNDKLSDNRAFIITGQAGMGKSIIAAVICRRFPKQFGACHFFKYDNSRYNNPTFLLQSLAWQLCSVFTEYRRNLVVKLSGNKGKILGNENIEGLFSMLFEEPFTNIPDPGKHFLIVIDALDECRQDEKHNLVDLITKHFHNFPRFIRFLITTRSEENIAGGLRELNPLFLKSDDERNLNDLQLFFDNTLKTTMEHVPREKLVKKLVEKSEGLMLYASFLCKLFEDSSIKTKIETLPQSIEDIYKSYFIRLENELKILSIDEAKFMSLLTVIAVAKQPLPLTLIERLLTSEKDLLSGKKLLPKLVSCISSFLVIKENCVSFFHKSIKDWLVKTNHRFTINEKYGHKILADICAYQMNTLKTNEVRFTYDDFAVKYSLQYGIPHMIQAEIQDMQSQSKLLDCVTDLEIVHACICIDVYITLNNLANLENHTNMCHNFNEDVLGKIKTLISIIRKFIYILKDIPHSFSQHVVDEKHEKLSSEATVLLMTRYRGLAYFNSVDDEENIKSALIGRIFTKDRVLDVDISPSEDFLICAYSEGVELFSLSNFKSLWKIDEFVVEMIYHPPADLAGIYYGTPPSIVFHPFKNVIFPGQLDRVLNLEGKFEPGPLTVEETNCKFTNCSYSHDKSKMATNYGNYLTVWNLLDNNKITRLLCRSKLYSILFSANDRFLATTNVDELCIYDTENSYCMTSRIYDVLDDPPFLISPYNSDSWYCSGEIVKYDLTRKPVSKRYKLLPKNARAAAEFQAFIESDDPRRFHTKTYLNIFVLRNGVAVAYWCYQHDLNMLSVTDLIQDFTLMQKSGVDSFSRCSISVDGKYIYKSSQHNTLGVPYGSFDIWMLSCSQCVKYQNVCQFKHAFTPFLPVTDGIFFCGEVSEHIGYDSELVESTPELWNSEVTERLFSFPELTGTSKCLSVGEDVIACVLKSQVCFFNVRTNEIVTSIPLTKHRSRSVPYPFESKVEVIACSSQYHVLMKNNKGTLLLQGENNFQPLPLLGLITSACFSPNGQLLAFATSGKRENRLYILDTSTLKIICEFSLYSPVSQMQLHFLDNELLLCKRFKSCLCLISIKTCDVLTCINVGLSDIPWIFSVSRKTGAIIVYSTNYVKDKEFKLIKLWLPHERKDVNELQCSCSIDAEGGTDSLIDMYSFQAAEIYSSVVSSCSIM